MVVVVVLVVVVVVVVVTVVLVVAGVVVVVVAVVVVGVVVLKYVTNWVYIQVSLNGGRTWHAATGRDTWTYLHRFRGPPASLADTSDCSTFRSDGDSAGGKTKLIIPTSIYCNNK